MFEGNSVEQECMRMNGSLAKYNPMFEERLCQMNMRRFYVHVSNWKLDQAAGDGRG
jgi:hypothetical protein